MYNLLTDLTNLVYTIFSLVIYLFPIPTKTVPFSLPKFYGKIGQVF